MGEWIETTLGSVAVVTMGQSPSGDSCNKQGEGTPLLNGPTEFGVFHPIPAQWTISPTKTAIAGDLLLCVRGSTTGRMNRADQLYVLGRGVCSIRSKVSERETRFIEYALKQRMYSLLEKTTGSVFPNLSRSDIESLSLPWPGQHERDAIPYLLGALDDKIAINDRIAASSRQLGEAMFHSFLENSFEEYELGKISTALIRGVAPRYTEDSEELLVLNQRCVRNGRVSLGQARRTVRERVSETKMLQRGDVLVNSTGVGTLGRVARWTGNVPCTVDSHVTIIRFEASQIDPVCAAFGLLVAQPEIERLGEGSTGQTELSRKKLGSFSVRIPDHQNCSKLRPVLESLEDHADSVLSENESLAQLRDTLLPKLMSGELRVKDAEKLVEDAT